MKKRRLGKSLREEASESSDLYKVASIPSIPSVPSMSSFIVDDEEDEYNDMYDDGEYDFENESEQPYKRNQKERLSAKELEELENIRKEMANEVPTLNKIINSNITKKKKKRCLRLFKQLQNFDQFCEEYYTLIDSINEILTKGNFYSKEEIVFLENEEEKLKKMFISNDTLKTKILKLTASDQIKSKLLRMYEEMCSYPSDSSTYTSLKEEIEWSIKLPYEKREVEPYVTMDNASLNAFYYHVRHQLNTQLYGMEKIKQRIIHVLNDRRSSGDSCGRNIALVGKPGTGKTAICKALSSILNKKFAKISAGALDSAAIKGSNKVWSGASPSIILQILADLKTNNAVIMIDEPDKMDIKGQHALLHVSDPADNNQFQDNYLQNFSHDLSKVLFIYCMNDDTCLDSAFRDRLDIIYVDEYNNYEKLQIFKNYMLPKALTSIGMNKTDIVIADAAIKRLLDDKNLGLRNLEKLIKDVVGKVNMYKSVILKDGTLGELELPYKINNFKLPLKIDYKMLVELM